MVWAVDVNRVLWMMARNAQAHGFGRARAHTDGQRWSPSVESDTRFDVIWSNSPVRIGKEAMHEMPGRLGRLAPAASPFGRPAQPGRGSPSSRG